METLIMHDFFVVLLITALGAFAGSMVFAALFMLEEFVRKLGDKL